MNILIISNMFPSRKDPVYGTFIKEFTDSFTSYNGVKNTKLIAIKGRNNFLPVKLLKYLLFYFKLLVVLVFEKFDIVYVHTITFPIVPIKLASKIKNLPLIFNTHGTDLLGTGKFTSSLREMAKPLLYNSLSIVSPSEYFKGEIESFLPGYPIDKIFVSPSGGVDTKVFHPFDVQKKDAFTIGFVSRIDEGKGWELFLEAVKHLSTKYCNIRGIIAGRGGQVEKMKLMIKKLDIGHIVKYVGPIPHDKLPEIFNQLDCFIFPSMLKESLGLVGIEALSCGVPVIASDRYGPTDYVEDFYNGLLFNIGNVDDLVRKIDFYYNLKEEKKQEFSKNARNSALKYDTEYIMDMLYDYLIKLIH